MDTKGSRSGYGRLPAEKAHDLRSPRKATARATREKSPATFFCLLVACLACCSNTAPKAATPLVTLDASWAIQARLQDPQLAWTAQDIQDKLFRISGQRPPILEPAGITPSTGRPVLRLEVLEPSCPAHSFQVVRFVARYTVW